MERLLTFVERAREELAGELYQREEKAPRSGRDFGRLVDRVVIWSLFVRMCWQRNVTPPRLADWEDAGGRFSCEFLNQLWERYEPGSGEPFAAETLGTVYESFLGRTITLTTNGPRFEATDMHRKSSGVFYTPEYIVDYIVEETVGKLITGKSPAEMRELRVLDPACGAGRFLLRVYDRVVEEHVRWFQAHGDEERLTHSTRCRILGNCVFGVDIDELAVEVARLSLYLKLVDEAPGEERSDSMTILATNIRCGDSLLPAGRGDFEVVLGNPPYGAQLAEAMRRRLAMEFDAGTTETAALMMLQAARKLTRRGGMNGFIVPKAFTYSSNWEKVRGELLEEMTALVDVGKVWPEVRLEQVIYFLMKGATSKSYTNRKRRGERFVDAAIVEKQHCGEFGFLVNGITREELEVGLKIRNAGSFLSEYLDNTRGARFQDQVTKSARGRRVIGGKQIQRYRIEGEKGFVSLRAALDKNAFVAAGSILVQNIVAHIENPVDHIKITAAVVDEEQAGEIVILDTVNQLTNMSSLSSYFFLPILNSRLMNWYVYRFIYAKAIRTMHFDGPVTARIPVPRITPGNQNLYEEIVREAKGIGGSEKMEAAVYALYGLSAERVAVIESGMARGKKGWREVRR